MKEREEFFVPYIEGSLGNRTKKTIKRFALFAVLIVAVGAVIFSFTQKPLRTVRLSWQQQQKSQEFFTKTHIQCCEFKLQRTLLKMWFY